MVTLLSFFGVSFCCTFECVHVTLGTLAVNSVLYIDKFLYIYGEEFF